MDAFALWRSCWPDEPPLTALGTAAGTYLICEIDAAFIYCFIVAYGCGQDCQSLLQGGCLDRPQCAPAGDGEVPLHTDREQPVQGPRRLCVEQPIQVTRRYGPCMLTTHNRTYDHLPHPSLRFQRTKQRPHGHGIYKHRQQQEHTILLQPHQPGQGQPNRVLLLPRPCQVQHPRPQRDDPWWP